MENDGRRGYHALSRAGLKVARGFHARWDVAACEVFGGGRKRSVVLAGVLR
ncbi:hypothetical protein A2U01_0108137, partial [Trifolium medium]|nr:hypothetical protein [Trifolium medium]